MRETRRQRHERESKMLILTRREGEAINIGDNVQVRVHRIHGGSIKLAIEAPKEVKVLRDELEKEVKLVRCGNAS